jgi:polysaccharide biosynthesis protein PslJ
MDFGEMFRILRRRWFVAVPALLLTLIATAGMYKAWPNTYQSQMQLTLLDSRSVASQQGNAGNPYLDFTASLDAVVDLLGRELSSDQSVSQLQALGVTDKYTAGIAVNAQGPFLAITVMGRSPAGIQQSMPILVSFAKRQLAALQTASSAPPSSLIQLVPIAPPSTPTKVLKTKVEIVAGVAVLGLVGSFLLSFIVDNLLTQRTARRKQKTNSVPDARPEQPVLRGRPAGRPGSWQERSSGPARR